jgi:hypothetical protein
MLADVPLEDSGSSSATAHAADAQQHANSPSPVAHTEPKSVPSVENPYIAKNKKKAFWKWAGFSVQLVTLIVVSIYTGIAYCQWKEMIKATNEAVRTNKQSAEAFRIDERAWVGIEKIEIMRTYPASGRFGAGFRFGIYPKNFGRTQAREVAFTDVSGAMTSITQGDNPSWVDSVQDQMLTGKFKGASDIPMNKAVPKVIGPGIASPVPFTVDAQEPQIFPKDEWVSYLIGRIDYTDAFHVRHWVKYCYFVVDAKGTLWPCKYGNDEDDNPETPLN